MIRARSASFLRSSTTPSPQDYGSVGFLLLPSEAPLSVDDRVWLLVEEDRFVENNTTVHRFQRIQVVRGEKLVEFDLDLGAATNFAAQPFAIFAAGEDRAGNVLDMAANYRRDKGVERAMADHLGEGNVVKQLIERSEQMAEYVRRNRRTTRRLLKG